MGDTRAWPEGGEAVVVLVGAPGSGKTTLREQLVAEGRVTAVLSLDDERMALRERDVAAGRPARDLQDYSLAALHRCTTVARTLLADRRGYLSDATHLRRKERVVHVQAARRAGVPAVAILLPDLPVAVLAERNAARPAALRVPEEVLTRHAHRRSLLDARMLQEEGFDEVLEVPVRDQAAAAAGGAEHALSAAQPIPGRGSPTPRYRPTLP